MASQLHRRGVEFDSVTALYKETSYVDQEQDANIALSELDKGHLSESLHLYAVILVVYQTLICYNNLHYLFRYFLKVIVFGAILLDFYFMYLNS